MAVYLIMFTVILLSLFCFSSQHQHVNDDHDHLIGELQEANLKIAQLGNFLFLSIDNLFRFPFLVSVN